MNATRKSATPAKFARQRTEKPPAATPAATTACCRRCGTTGPVGEDGFCAKCEKALEQACL